VSEVPPAGSASDAAAAIQLISNPHGRHSLIRAPPAVRLSLSLSVYLRALYHVARVRIDASQSSRRQQQQQQQRDVLLP